MNREQMIEAIERRVAVALGLALHHTFADTREMEPGPRTMSLGTDIATVAVDALIAAGCVPSDELTQAAAENKQLRAAMVRARILIEHYGDTRGAIESLERWVDLTPTTYDIGAAVTPDERNEP